MKLMARLAALLSPRESLKLLKSCFASNDETRSNTILINIMKK